MSRFKRASHVIWHCQYHIVWVPKYRFRVLQGPVGEEVYKCVMVFSQQLGCEVVELNVQPDHVHLLVSIPPKELLSNVVFGLIGAIRRQAVAEPVCCRSPVVRL
jgi:putative transposase